MNYQNQTEEMELMSQNGDFIRSFKVYGVRTITSPSNKGITTYYTWVNFKELPEDIPLDVNPREPKMNTAVAKKLLNAVVSTDDLNFDINNRGIVITAKEFKFDTSSNTIILNLGDDKLRYGILDGGHTYTAIMNKRHELPSDIDKFVKLEIIIGDSLDVSGLADARNRSAQVSDVALFELDDKFDFIKDSIRDQPYADDIAIKDFENKSIPIEELLKLMFAFNIKRFPDGNTAPVSAYSGKAAVFRDFKKEIDNELNSNTINIYRELAPFLPNLVDLYEQIQKDLYVMYRSWKEKEGAKKINFGNIRGIEKTNAARTAFKQDPLEYNISIGFLLPIFGAFRALLVHDKKTGVLQWQFDPFKVWEVAGESLVQNTFDTDTNPQMAGKNKTLWQSNYRIIDGVRKDMLLEELLKNQ